MDGVTGKAAGFFWKKSSTIAEMQRKQGVEKEGMEGEGKRRGNEICYIPCSFCNCVVVVVCHTGQSVSGALVNL